MVSRHYLNFFSHSAGDDEDDVPLSPKYLADHSSPNKSSAIRDAISGSDTETRKRHSSSASAAALTSEEGVNPRRGSKDKGKEVEDEEELDDTKEGEDKETKDATAQRKGSDIKRQTLSNGRSDGESILSSDSDDESVIDEENRERSGSEVLPRWSHMSMRRMLQEVKKRAKQSGTSILLKQCLLSIAHLSASIGKGIVTMMSITGDGTRRKKEEQDELLILIDDLIYLLKRLPDEYKANSYAQLLYQMEQV